MTALPLGRAALVAAGLAAALLLGELVLRVADRADWISRWREARQARESSIWMASDDPVLVYRHRPDYRKDGVRYTERHGILRPRDVASEAGPGGRRVIALGDSIIAGLDLAYEERVLTRLEVALAAAAAGPVEVLNFGVNGYDTLQEARLFETLAAGFSGDRLLLQYCVNDFHPTRYPMRWFLPRPRSRLLELAQLWLGDGRLDGYPPAAYWEELYRSDRQGWDNVTRGFARIAGLARERGMPALLVIVPAISHEGWSAGDAAGRHARVARIAREAGFEVLDLLPLFAHHPIESLRAQPWDSFHPNARGHRIAAEAIAAALGPLGPSPAQPRR